LSGCFCRHDDEQVDAVGKWTQRSGARAKSYSESVNPNDVARVCGWGDAHINPMTHYCPPQGALIPPESVRAFIYPHVLQLHDGTVLDVIKAIQYVKERQVRPLHSFGRMIFGSAGSVNSVCTCISFAGAREASHPALEPAGVV
jgi:hypothetical protein